MEEALAFGIGEYSEQGDEIVAGVIVDAFLVSCMQHDGSGSTKHLDQAVAAGCVQSLCDVPRHAVFPAEVSDESAHATCRR